ncbi:MAG: alanyl-tRNA editing protein, partial [Thermoplasmata archaeon]|nr:alanyl-tRNA editing protein [Thermoplasmata archaeon]
HMTEYLYMKDVESNYIKEFDAVVKGVGSGFVVLDRSVFYPLGGCQPTDKGTLEWDGNTVEVKEVRKKGGQHMITGEISRGTRVHGVLDWERRYGHMRMHTAQHIISGIVYDLYGARTVGNQIHADRSRIDFFPSDLGEEELRKVAEMCNEAFAKDIPIKIYEMGRDALEAKVGLERANLDLIPEFIKTLRVIDIEGLDICPCAGTHVRSTGEIGRMCITACKNKGKEKQRVEYVLE